MYGLPDELHLGDWREARTTSFVMMGGGRVEREFA